MSEFFSRVWLATLLGCTAAWPAGAWAEEVVFPADAGVIDVTQPPYSAKHDGVSDDTAALQSALDAHPSHGAILYLPAGTYLISDTLKWPHGTLEGSEESNTILQGQSRDGTILKLKDGCPGFDDANRSKAMIWTGKKPGQHVRNAIRNLTINTGRRNRGGVGLQFMASKQGCVRDVTILSEDGAAHIGLDLSHSDEIGPCLVKNVRVVGFGVGIRTAFVANCITFENITLERQWRSGFVNEGPCVSIRGLTSRNTVTAVVNEGDSGVLTLLDASFSGTRRAQMRPALLNEATLYARNIAEAGYNEAIRNISGGERTQVTRKVEEFVSHPVASLFPSGSRSLHLPVKETPEVPWDDLADWASPTHFGGRPNDNEDDTAAIQAAIDSGKPTVYLPNGYYQINNTILIRKNVRRLIGCEATLGIPYLGGKPAFQVVEGSSPVVVFERLQAGYSRTPTLDNLSGRTLVIRDCFNINANITGPGDLFLEDVSSNPFTGWRFGRQNVWARQLAVENEGTHIVNDGGTLWILGLKTERGGTLVETIHGGQTEILGGLCLSTGGPKTAPMFLSTDSAVSVTIGERNGNGHPFPVLISETRGGTTKTFGQGDAPRRAGGSVIPLFVAQPLDP